MIQTEVPNNHEREMTMKSTKTFSSFCLSDGCVLDAAGLCIHHPARKKEGKPRMLESSRSKSAFPREEKVNLNLWLLIALLFAARSRSFTPFFGYSAP
jgi:hypothetical protein